MLGPIQPPVAGLAPTGAVGSTTAARPATEPATSFESSLGAAVASVDQQQRSADEALKLLASGENTDLHGAMIELEKADIALRAMVGVRDKLVGAYEQIMNMAL